MKNAVVQSAIFLAFLAVVLFGAAGRFDWPMAWVFLSVYAAFFVIALLRFDPELILERTEIRAGVKRWDLSLATVSYVLCFPVMMLIAGLDWGRFEWSPPLSLGIRLAALAGFLLATGLLYWAMAANQFFSSFVRIQADRGHYVIDRGPYAYVRHPGYTAMTASALSLSVALGSLWGLAPTIAGTALFVVRTMREERALIEELPGYRDYIARVRWRLLPGVW